MSCIISRKSKFQSVKSKNQHFTEKIQNFLQSITHEKIKNFPLKSQNVIPVNDESQGNSNPFQNPNNSLIT